ncbi:MAG TPA: hypothetical protein VHH72_07060 [Solirubrobacterales bacterium]|nr:hypothetical protein [Solirubrobacterales bacterium]
MGRLLRTAVLAAIAYALWQYLKTVLDEPQPQLSPVGPEQPAPPRSEASQATPESNPSAAAERSNGGGARRSKAELYEEAQRLGIKGRSKMSKAELERAIRDAR